MDATTPSYDECSRPQQTTMCEATVDTNRMPLPVAASAHANLAGTNSPLTEWLSTLSPEPDDHPHTGRHSRDYNPADN